MFNGAKLATNYSSPISEERVVFTDHY
jgi:hypothetical protein